MFLKSRISLLSLSIISLLVLAAPTAAFAANQSSVVHSASAIPSTRMVLPNTASKLSMAGVSPDKLTKQPGYWGGYGQYDADDDVAGGADGWIVPSATCNPSSPYPQYTALFSWYDGYSGNVPAGLVLVCTVGQSGSATIYMGDGISGFFTGIASPGDEVTSFAAAYNSTTFIYYTVDWTAGYYVLSYWNIGGQIPYTDFNGVIDTYGGGPCSSTTTGSCPQVSYGTIEDGAAFLPGFVCAFNPDGTTPAFPCVGYGTPFTSSTYFYPIGMAPKHYPSTTVYMYLMKIGDTSFDKTFSTTGKLVYGDHASHTYTFKHA